LHYERTYITIRGLRTACVAPEIVPSSSLHNRSRVELKNLGMYKDLRIGTWKNFKNLKIQMLKVLWKILEYDNLQYFY